MDQKIWMVNGIYKGNDVNLITVAPHATAALGDAHMQHGGVVWQEPYVIDVNREKGVLCFEIEGYTEKVEDKLEVYEEMIDDVRRAING